MVKSKSLDSSVEIITLILRKSADGQSGAKIARDLFMKPRTVQSIIRRQGKGAKRTGRPTKISPQSERSILRVIRQNPDAYSDELKEHIAPVVEVSARTVRRFLKKHNLNSRCKRRVPLLTKKQIVTRLRFARKYRDAPLEFWHRVLWSDESKLASFAMPRMRVWRKPGTAYLRKHVAGVLKHSPKHLMVWGCCAAGGVGTLHEISERMTASIYIKVLKKNLGASKRKLALPRDWVFMHDNDPKHTARRTKLYLRRTNVQVLEWPPNSPDLNPIEHLWGILKKRYANMRKKMSVPFNFTTVEKEWNSIPESVVRDLIESMPRRLAATIRAKGGNTKY